MNSHKNGVMMRIENIKLQNYRQFREIEIDFNKKYENDLHFLVGKNGTGKTNLLNALNWCLYGEESHLSKKSKSLPILNLNSIEDTEDGKDVDVNVEVQFNTEYTRSIIFTRKGVYRIYKSEKQPMHQRDEFEGRIVDDKGNSKLLCEDDANSYVERFVPKRIRDFFFFDGERLDNYFRKATTQNIRNAIFVISQIELLENKIEKRIDDTLRQFRRDAGKVNPKIDQVRNELEEAKEADAKVKDEIKDRNKEISIAKDGIRECEAKLQGIPDLDKLKEEKLQLKASRKHNKELLDTKVKEKQDTLFELGILVMLSPIIKKSIKTIEEKRKKKEIPPPADISLLEEILKNKICSICGTSLNSDLEQRVKKLVEEVRFSSTVATQLSNMENPLRLSIDKAKQFKDKMKTLNYEIINYEKELEKIEKKISQIDKNLFSYDAKEIKEWVEQQKIYEEQLEKNQRRLGWLLEKKKELSKEIKGLESQFDNEANKETRVQELTKKIEFTKKALGVVKKTKEIIMKETRERIESETKNLFFQLIWKKETFKNISISEDYDINLMHQMGYPCLGSISAAERELLALSFTLALHKVSGFESPVLIDTPVARVSDEHRENLGKIFSEISKDKQIILLFTPAEYSPEISKPLDKLSSNRFNLKLSSDEKEIKLEVI